MGEWFESWFDTTYYHKLYKKRDFVEAERFIKNLFQFLNPGEKARVLDLACGKGRHAIFVNSLGYDTTGVDLSKNSIKHAKEFENETLRFFRHDMRDQLDQSNFDVVLNLFTSFGYFENKAENEQVIAAISASLKSDGYLVIDFFNANQVLANLVECEEIQRDELKFQISKEIIDGKVVKHIRFDDKGKSYHYQEKVQLLALKDFKHFLSQANFSIEHIFGNYDLEPFNNNSDRLIIIAKKKK